MPIRAEYAYARGYTGNGVVIAIVDSGLDVNHPEFRNRISPYRGNFVDGYAPGDLSDLEADGVTIDGHGTHVAGLAAAARDGTGIQGVAYNATVLPLRSHFTNEQNSSAFDRAIQAGAKVLNGSYGPDAYPTPTLIDPYTRVKYPNPNYRKLEYQAIFSDVDSLLSHYKMMKRAAQADIVMVFAAGNERPEQPLGYTAIPSGNGMFPLITPSNTRASVMYRFLDNVEGVQFDIQNPNTWGFQDPSGPELASLDFSDLQGTLIAVVAVARDGRLASYSNRCGATAPWCIAAPGGDSGTPGYPGQTGQLASTYPYGTYQYMAGTSMASPIVAGAAAVLREAFPYMTARQIIEVVLTTANNTGEWSDPTIYGHGLLDLGRAVQGPAQFGSTGFPSVFSVNTQGYDSIWSNNISGTGGLAKAGAGTLTLTGINLYSGNTLVTGGKLVVNGSIAASVLTTVAHDGALGGYGTVGNLRLAGLLTPGNSIGTLTVAGDYTQLTGSVLEVEFDAAGNTDLVSIQGSADIQGGELRVVGLEADEIGHDYTFLTAKGGIHGAGLTGIDLNRAFLDLTPRSNGSSLQLGVRRNAVRFVDLARTLNQRAVAGAIDTQGVGDEPYNQAVLLRKAYDAPDMYDALSGEIHASTQSALLDTGDFLRRAALTRTRQAKYGDTNNSAQVAHRTSGGAVTLWGQGLGSWGRLGASADAQRLTRSTGGLIFGGDIRLGKDAWAGLATGVTESKFDGTGSSGVRARGYHLMAYAGTQQGPWALRGGLSQSWYRLDTRRYIDFGNYGTARSHQQAGLTQFFGEAGYGVPLGSVLFEPYAGVAQLWLRSGSFQESGSLASLRGSAATQSVIATTLGLRASLTLQDGSSSPIFASLGMGWRHASGDVAPIRSLRFASGAGYQISGVPLARNALVIEAGLGLKASERSRIDLAYTGQIAGSTHDHGVQLHAGWTFW